jgi:hypothetical protein
VLVKEGNVLIKLQKVVGCFALIVATSVESASPGPFASKELGLEGSIPKETDFERPFESPLPALIRDGSQERLQQLNNCRDYLSLRKQIVGSDNDLNYRALRYQVAPCVALALLKSASEATRSALPAEFTSQLATTAYPATLWPAVSDEETKNLSKPGLTLKSAIGKPAFRKVDGGALDLEGKGMGLELTLLARGDFDHDGWEDAAFRWQAWALKGSYVDSQTIVLTRTASKAVFRQLDVDWLLEGH